MKPRAAKAKHVPGGSHIFHRIHARLGCPGRPPHFVVEFFPYANLTHTVRLRDDIARVRLSDILRGAPLAVLEATAALLLARLYRCRVPPNLRKTYRSFSLAGKTRRRLLVLRRLRARAPRTNPQGSAHNLEKLFARLNRRYFGRRLRQPNLLWSAHSWRAQLGCFDPGLHQIVINSSLDRPSVPAHVVEYVLFHEMLHMKHPARVARCALESHSSRFRREEKRFALYDQARRFLRRLA